MNAFRNCQSCGMPFSKDPKGGGSNADGSKSLKYCSHCIVDGIFTRPEIDTAEKMQIFVKEKLKEIGFPSFIARIFTLGIPKLERWKKQS